MNISSGMLILELELHFKFCLEIIKDVLPVVASQTAAPHSS